MEEAPKRQMRTKEERRKIVEETLQPGVSVSRVARAHDINTNLVFQWRLKYRKGLLNVKEAPTALLPVTISNSADKPSEISGRRMRMMAAQFRKTSLTRPLEPVTSTEFP
jgi:transposase-like protein